MYPPWTSRVPARYLTHRPRPVGPFLVGRFADNAPGATTIARPGLQGPSARHGSGAFDVLPGLPGALCLQEQHRAIVGRGWRAECGAAPERLTQGGAYAGGDDGLPAVDGHIYQM